MKMFTRSLSPATDGRLWGYQMYNISVSLRQGRKSPFPEGIAPPESKITGVYSSKNARVIITWKKLGFITTFTRRRTSTQLFKMKWHGRAPSQDWPYFTPSNHPSMPGQWAWSPLVTPPDWLAVDKSLISWRSIIIMAHQDVHVWPQPHM